MTEAEWLASVSPLEMADFLGERLSERKTRLFHCACVRSVWAFIPDSRSRRAVEAAERFADGRASGPELAAAHEAAEVAWRRLEGLAFLLGTLPVGNPAAARFHAGQSAQHAASPSPRQATWAVCYGCFKAVEVGASCYDYWARGVDRRTEMAQQAALLRDVVGNPFRPGRIDPAWLALEDGIIPRLAAAMYEEQTFDRLPVLGDALEEAGCTDERMLEHCRSGGEHVCGCWVVDLVLGRS